MENRNTCLWKVVSLALLVHCVLAWPCRAALSRSEIDQKVSALESYKEGMDRTALMAIEQLIRDTQNKPELRKYLELKLAALLESKVSTECKLFICRQLWVIGTDDSIDAVAALLKDEATADMACYAIGQNPSAKASQALRQALPQVSARTKVRIINLLGDRRDTASVPVLGELVFGDEREVAEAAISALGKIGGQQARQILAKVRAQGKADLRFAATDAYLRCAEHFAEQGQRAAAIEIYRELANLQEPPVFRSAALRGMAELGDPQAISLVVAALQDKNRTVRAVARSCVRLIPGSQATQQLAAQLTKLPAQQRALLIAALADRGDPAALAHIVAATKDPDPAVKHAAIRAIGKLGDASSVPLLARLLAETKDRQLSQVICASLTMLQGPDVDDQIVKAMQDAEPTSRARLIEVLYDRNAVTAVAPLIIEAKKSGPKVQKSAFKALGRLAGPKDLPVLLSLLAELSDRGVRRAAERAIITVARKAPVPPSRSEPVLKALAGEDAVPVRCSLLRVLGGIADDKALEALYQAVSDPNPMVKDTAIRQLASWPDAAAVPAVVDIYTKSTDKTHRLLALRGLVRQLALPDQVCGPDQTLQLLRRAIEAASGPDELKLILSALANVGHPKALELATPYMQQQQVRVEAALAVLNIAAKTAPLAPQRAKEAAEKVLSVTSDKMTQQRAQELLKLIESFGDYITAWQVAGPYMQQGKAYNELFEIPFAPEKPDAGDVRWRLMAGKVHSDRPYVVDLLSVFGGEQRVAYLRTWIYSEQRQQAHLEIGSDDGIKVWLNGQLVHANNVARSLTPGSDKVNVTLQTGWNTLLVKLTQNNMGWELCARFRSPDGAALKNLRVDCLHQRN